MIFIIILFFQIWVLAALTEKKNPKQTNKELLVCCSLMLHWKNTKDTWDLVGAHKLLEGESIKLPYAFASELKKSIKSANELEA